VSLPRLRDRYRGALLGLACGDAVGTTVEFQPRDSFAPLQGMVGGGPFALAPGRWTDDTSMALCLAESLVTQSGFDAADQMARYANWYGWGYWSSTGVCFVHGESGIPADWLETLHQRQEIAALADSLLARRQARAGAVSS